MKEGAGEGFSFDEGRVSFSGRRKGGFSWRGLCEGRRHLKEGRANERAAKSQPRAAPPRSRNDERTSRVLRTDCYVPCVGSWRRK